VDQEERIDRLILEGQNRLSPHQIWVPPALLASGNRNGILLGEDLGVIIK